MVNKPNLITKSNKITLHHGERMMLIGHIVAKIYYFEINKNREFFVDPGLNCTEHVLHVKLLRLLVDIKPFWKLSSCSVSHRTSCFTKLRVSFVVYVELLTYTWD